MKHAQVNILVVAAHPDDEVIGVGGAVARHAMEGARVGVLFLADGLSSRVNVSEKGYQARWDAATRACEILGVSYIQRLGFPDNQLDSVPLLQIVQKVEHCIDEFRPEIVYAHHGGDLNIDHRCCFQAVMTACRPQPGFGVRAIRCFETRSATEWAGSTMGGAFLPNFYIDISSSLEKKLAALQAYAMELRLPPHSRSLKAIEAQAIVRGAEVGLTAAEAFHQVRAII